MPLTAPNLDDRSFDQLLADAESRITQLCPEWTDHTRNDPGIVLLELFAYLTETMIYRLNRLPEKAYIEFLRLIGVRVQPPAAAGVALLFLNQMPDHAVEIPRGTQVTIARASAETESPVFTTARTVRIEAGKAEAAVQGFHAELVEAERAGIGTGLPGLSVVARRPPIVMPTGDDLDLLVGVEASREELGERVRSIEHGGKAYRIWQEVGNFADLAPDTTAYVADRLTGMITFAPAVQMSAPDGSVESIPRPLAAVPPKGREILLWYRRGGGPEGNVSANSLTMLRSPIPGIQVNNPLPATGGRAAESLENALRRGPQELHSLERAVTARDFELVALKSSGAIARATAFTKASLWRHATPGTVEVLLVPNLPEEIRGTGVVTAERLKEQETEDSRLRAQHALDERRPLGTTCLVGWVRYKTARVRARVVVHRGEDEKAVRARVQERLHLTINPLPTRLNSSGWRFGVPLRVAQVYEIILAEPGVSYAEGVRLVVDEVPEKGIVSVAADAFQPKTWYAVAGSVVYRTLNDGDGWEPAGRFPEEQVSAIQVHPRVPGLIAAATFVPGGAPGTRIYVSRDCGESWRFLVQVAFTVEDMAWMLRDQEPVLLLATDLGLYELAPQPGAVPLQILVDPDNPNLGFYSVAVSVGALGGTSVAVAARNLEGVFLSNQAARPETFRHIGLRGEYVRVLEVQSEGPNSFLWAGVAAPGDVGKGCFRYQIWESGDAPEGWRAFATGWDGGSCLAIAFSETQVFAATHYSGVVWLDLGERDPKWRVPHADSKLPIQELGRFYPVSSVAADSAGRMLLAGGQEGVFRSRDRGVSYENCSSKEFLDQVTLPSTWLFCSGEHEIETATEGELRP